jgi:hypothetical protein
VNGVEYSLDIICWWMAFNPYGTYLSQPFMNLKERRAILQNNKKLVERKLNDVLESYNLIGQSFLNFTRLWNRQEVANIMYACVI